MPLELRKCRTCEKYLTLDHFERKTVCKSCTEKTREERDRREAEKQSSEYIVVCEICKNKLDANKTPWICGKCVKCWPPIGTRARVELEKIWRKVNGRS